MDSSALFNLIDGGTKPVVKFLSGIEDQETCIDRGMYGRIINVRHEHDDVYVMYIDLSDFEGHNDSVAQHNYYDSDGNPTKTAKEAGQYPENGIETFYVDYGRDLSDILEIDDSGVNQIVSVKVTEAKVHRNEGQSDIIVVTLPVPMPLSDFEGSPVQMTLLADEGTGVAYLKEHFGIVAGETDEPFDFAEALASYGIDIEG